VKARPPLQTGDERLEFAKHSLLDVQREQLALRLRVRLLGNLRANKARSTWYQRKATLTCHHSGLSRFPLPWAGQRGPSWLEEVEYIHATVPRVGGLNWVVW